MEKRKFDVKKMVMLALLSAIAYILMMYIKVPVVLFLKYEPKDVVIILSAYLFGPLSGIAVSGIVSLLEMVTVSDTGPIGCLMNFISTCTFMVPAALIYHRKKNIRGVVVGLIVGVVTMVAAMMLWNYLITPIYMGYPREDVAAMLLPAFLPFNLVKGGINAAFVALLYKPFFRVLRLSQFTIPESETADSKKNTLLLIIGAVFLLATCVYLVLVLRGIL